MIRRCDCGRAKENRGPATRTVQTCVGSIQVSRRYWQCRCGVAGAYAADAVVGLDGRWTRTLQRHACRLAADVSFTTAREHLRELLGVSICAETLRTLSERHGQAMAGWQGDDAVGVERFRRAQGEVEFTVDAGKVNTREEGWKDLKIGVFQKRAAGQPVSAEAWDEQRLPAATARVAFAAIAPIKRFRRCWRRWSRRLGVAQTGGLHVLADGAGWIWKAVDRVFPASEQTLDIYHASEHLNQASVRLYGEGSAEAAAAWQRGRSLLLSSGWAGWCTWMGEQLSQSDTPSRRAVLEKATKYFSKHVRRLNYATQLAAGRAIGSGVVEGQAKTLGLRLKARGARWKKANVRKMASLVCVRHSDQWESYWSTAA